MASSAFSTAWIAWGPYDKLADQSFQTGIGQKTTVSLPDGTSVYCPLPWLVTGYGRLNQCTNLIRGPWGTFGKVGIYNRDLSLFTPESD